MKCKLCHKEAPIMNSHIIPEFIYKTMYDENHRALLIPSDSKRKVKLLQKGIREELLCKECENLISKNEKYAYQLIFDAGNLNLVENGNNSFRVINNVDYAKYKLFQLSILFRANVSSHLLFSMVDLGPYAEPLRQLVLNNNPGKYDDFACIMSSLTLNNDYIDVITPVSKLRIEKRICYRFVFGGFYWVYFISGLPKRFNEYVLQNDGRLFLFIEDAKQVDFFSKDIYEIRKRNQDIENILQPKKPID